MRIESISQWETVTQTESGVRSDSDGGRCGDEIADDRGGQVGLGDRHGDGHASVLVFRLLDSHFRADVSVLGRLDVDTADERSAKTEIQGRSGGHQNGEENQSLLFWPI